MTSGPRVTLVTTVVHCSKLFLHFEMYEYDLPCNTVIKLIRFFYILNDFKCKMKVVQVPEM